MGKASEKLLPFFLVILSGITLQVCAQDGSAQEHLALIERNVRDISLKLADIFNATFTCGADPLDCPICSADVCAPKPEGSTSCLTNIISDLYKCDAHFSSTSNSTCSSIQVSANASSVSFVRTELNDAPTEVQKATLCRSQPLDETFADIWSRSNIFATYYIGTIDGSFRTFPGMDLSSDSCSRYDSRLRPWYIGGISYPSYLIILIDCGHGMRSDSTEPGTGRFRLDDAKDLASHLLGTVSDEDYVNVITFGANSDDTYNTSARVVVNYTNSQAHPELEHLHEKINSLTPGDESTTVSSFLRGLNTTLIAFNDTKLPDIGRPPRLRNVIVITDGAFTDTSVDVSSDPSVDIVLNQLKQNNVRLFMYGINAVGSDQKLRSLADRVNGVYENLTDTDNPLFNMRSYFGFLAFAHRSLFGDEPFWGQDYVDFFGVGQIVTVTMPAITSDGRFVGVAAIDVILNELPFRENFMVEVSKRRTQQGKTMLTASGAITEPVPPTPEDSSCRYNRKGVLCPSPAPGKDPQFAVCCNSCDSGGDDTSRPGGIGKKKLGIILGSVLGFVGIVAMAIAGFIGHRIQKQYPPGPPHTPAVLRSASDLVKNNSSHRYPFDTTGNAVIGR